MLKKIRYFIENIATHILKVIILFLPINIASYTGGFLAKRIGKFLKVNKIAKNNIKIAFPDLSNHEVDTLCNKVWDNLGRTAFEFFHLQNIDINKISKIEGLENIPNCNGKTRLFFSAHLANWEVIPKIAAEKGLNLKLVYRKANNPYTEKLINNARGRHKNNYIPKGKQGAKQLLRAINKGDDIAMLVDQKMNDGISVPFFGSDAMTPSAIASLAIKYDCPIIPTQIIRHENVKFTVKIFPELKISKEENYDKNIFQIMSEINLIIEGWIKENPEQWMWVHNRWKK